MLEQVAVAAGMARRGRRWSPCPACGAHGSKNDARPPVLLGRGGKWRCLSCGEGGDSLALAGHHLGYGGSPKGSAYFRAAEFVRSAEGLELPQEAVAPDLGPSTLPVAKALSGCLRLRDVRDPRLDPFLAAKGLTREAPAGYLVRQPEWFPSGFPLVVPAFNAAGELTSMHGRSLDISGRRTKTWPRGVSSTGLLLLDPQWARPWLRGGTPPSAVLIAEGITDYLAASAHMPVIGVTSGSFEALKLIRFERDTSIYSALDPDRAGERYAMKLADAVWPLLVHQLPLKRLSKVLDG